MGSADVQRDIAACTISHQHLITTVDGLTDADVWQPSLLPGWSVGHVLTHLARNAESFVRLLRAAGRGEVVSQYEGGVEGRASDIEAGARRPADVIVADLRMSIFHLEQAFDDATELAWSGSGLGVRGEIAIATLPQRRRMETEVHHIDLGLGYTSADWPDDFVRNELRRLTATWASRQPMGLTDLPQPVLALTPAQRLEWLAGRRTVEGVQPPGVLV